LQVSLNGVLLDALRANAQPRGTALHGHGNAESDREKTILTTAQLAALVKNGTVRYFLLNGSGGGGPGGGGQSTLTTWITQHAKVVSSSQWQSSSTSSSSSGVGGSEQLYEFTSAS
jgi:hypothetical protein